MIGTYGETQPDMSVIRSSGESAQPYTVAADMDCEIPARRAELVVDGAAGRYRADPRLILWLAAVKEPKT